MEKPQSGKRHGRSGDAVLSRKDMAGLEMRFFPENELQHYT
jgi:hypothetical protein